MPKQFSHGLIKALDLHFRVEADEYEFIARSSASNSIADETRRRWLTPGWQKKLEALRAAHRKAGIKDADFIHPKVAKAAMQSSRKGASRQ